MGTTAKKVIKGRISFDESLKDCAYKEDPANLT